jgi:hypothetical protein
VHQPGTSALAAADHDEDPEAEMGTGDDTSTDPTLGEPVAITVIDGDAVTTVAGRRHGDSLLVDRDALATATGWALKPEGLCRDEVCIPTRAWPELTPTDDADLVDLTVFGALVRRPAVVDADEAVAAFGIPADERAAPLTSLHAPPFTLASLDGEDVALADFRGRKKLLIAFASW